MSAAIEGIQTCFHASHSSADGESSILHTHPLTYPMLLIGFAVVGILMQWCAIKVHEMREVELKQIRLSCKSTCLKSDRTLNELNADQLVLAMESNRTLDKDKSYNFVESKTVGKSRDTSQISLKSVANIEQRPTMITVDLMDNARTKCDRNSKEVAVEFDRHSFLRYLISPMALVSCALIVYFIHVDIVSEIADAFLSILVVVMQFVAAYPPMKRSGRVLLQSAPCDVDLDKLRQDLLSISEHLVAVKELHVWSLTSSDEGRVGTCQLVLQRSDIQTAKQLSLLVDLARLKFAEQGINCVSIGPMLIQESLEVDDSQDSRQHCDHHHHHHHHHD